MASQPIRILPLLTWFTHSLGLAPQYIKSIYAVGNIHGAYAVCIAW
jgi:hypothetical protein